MWFVNLSLYHDWKSFKQKRIEKMGHPKYIKLKNNSEYEMFMVLKQ